VARWLVVLSALVQVLFRVRKPYMITVKGVADARPRALRATILLPYLVAIFVSLAACWYYTLRYRHSHAQGSLFFALEGALLFLVLIATVWFQDLRSLRRLDVSVKGALRLGAAGWTALSVAGVLLLTTAVAATPRILQAVGR
jgi:hypothetical protein